MAAVLRESEEDERRRGAYEEEAAYQARMAEAMAPAASPVVPSQGRAGAYPHRALLLDGRSVRVGEHLADLDGGEHPADLDGGDVGAGEGVP